MDRQQFTIPEKWRNLEILEKFGKIWRNWKNLEKFGKIWKNLEKKIERKCKYGNVIIFNKKKKINHTN